MIENAKITSAKLEMNHGCLVLWLMMEFSGGAQGFGGYALDKPLKDGNGKFIRSQGTAYGIEWILRLMKLFRVEDFSKLAGQSCRIDKEDHSGPIKRVGHYIKDEWFDPEDIREMQDET